MSNCERCGATIADGESTCRNCENSSTDGGQLRTTGAAGPAGSHRSSVPEQTRSRRELLKYGGSALAALAGIWLAVTDLFGTPDPRRTAGLFYTVVRTGTDDQFERLWHPVLSVEERTALRIPLALFEDVTLTGLKLRRQHDGRAVVRMSITGQSPYDDRKVEQTLEYELRLLDGHWRMYDILKPEALAERVHNDNSPEESGRG